VTVDPPRTHVDGALLVSLGAPLIGREHLADAVFTELSRFLGQQLSDGDLTSFQPFFFADGPVGGIVGFFLLEGRREVLDGLQREEAFVRLLLKVRAAYADVRVDTLLAGPDAGRMVNLAREVHGELGLA
jgi:hypothetical protein